MDNFQKGVFINCPFDPEYRQLLLAAIFSVKYLGFEPKISLQNSDSGTTRLSNILDLILSSKYGIHDLSRMLSVKKDEPARMNMPFELGIDFGCKKFKGGKYSTKKILVLEKEKYRYQAALSDLSGSDIKNHDDDPMMMVKVIRDWFVTEELRKGPSHNIIWFDFNEFSSDLEMNLSEQGHNKDDYEKIPIPEVMAYMDDWFEVK